MALVVRSLAGPDLAKALDAVAALRIAVFRDFPYLYDGDAAYERRYLEPYLRSAGALVVGAFEGAELVGASTALPLADHDPEVGEAVARAGYDAAKTHYCAESVLLPGYRGQGVGHAFFDHREAHARAFGSLYCCFCAVLRPHDHPARPAAYRPLDPFWRARGYRPLPGITATLSWKDLGDPAETPKPLQLWMRRL